MEIRPIRSAKQHQAALDEIERLWSAKLGTREHDRLEVLATLGEDFEERHPGRRRLTLDMIRRLHKQLGIPAEVLLAS